MAQPVSGNNYVSVIAAGTTVTSTRGSRLANVLIGGTYVGSVEWYDSSTAAGTAAGNLIYAAPIPGANQLRSIEVNARTKNGIVTVATGTPVLQFTWE